jgi:FkbH-like protein
MNETELRAILAKQLEVDPTAIDDRTSAETLSRWDSLVVMNLVFELEPRIGRQFTDDEVATLTSWPNLRAAVGIAAPQPFYKVLVLDGDGTLWEGVAGEDDRVVPFTDAQRTYASLQKRGVLLCLLSRNTRATLEAMLSGELPIAAFVEVVAECGNKAMAIDELARKLNLDPSAFVFVDDSPFEIASVRQMLPQVHAVQVPPGASRQVAEEVAALFPTMVDTSKTEQYRALAAAAATRDRFATEEAFLASLGIVVDVHVNEPDHAERIAELLEKAHQLNLTSWTGSAADLRALSDGLVCSVGYRDRFGDQGLVGAIVISGGEVRNVVFSCRVLGRGIEYAIWPTIVTKLDNPLLDASFVPNGKNGAVADYWPKLGLQTTPAKSKDGSSHYRGRIAAAPPAWIEVRNGRLRGHVPEAR